MKVLGNMSVFLLLVLAIIAAVGCGGGAAEVAVSNNAVRVTPAVEATPAGGESGGPAATPQTGPRTVMDYFALLPEKYFLLEGCDRATDKDCSKARAEYIKNMGEVVDVKNGYFKGGCDGGQSCIEMAIFKRPDGTYMVGVATFAEMMNEFYFLDYANGEWRDVSAEVVPDYAGKWYELPRVGTTMKVFEKKIVERTADFEISERGRQLYELAWKDGRFVKN